MTTATMTGADDGYLQDAETDTLFGDEVFDAPLWGPDCFDADWPSDPAPDVPAAIAAILDRIEMIERRCDRMFDSILAIEQRILTDTIRAAQPGAQTP